MKRMFFWIMPLFLFISLAWPAHGDNVTSWTWLNPLPQGNALRAIWGPASDDIYAAGDLGALLHYDGQAWRVVENVPNRQSILGLWGSGPNDIFAVGHDTLWHYDGAQWREMTPPTGGASFLMRGVWGASSNDVYAAGFLGDRAAIFHYNGASWTRMNIPSLVSIDLNAIWGGGTNNVFAVGDQGVILHYNGGAWRQMNAGVDVDLFGVWSLGPNLAYAVGGDPTFSDQGVALRYNGTSWSEAFSKADELFIGVWGFDANNIYIISKTGNIYHFDGQSWREEGKASARASNAFAIWGLNPNNLFVVGDYGLIAHYDGAAWKDQVQGPPFWTNRVWTDGVRVVVVGNGPQVLRYDGARWILEELPGEVGDAWAYHTYDIWGLAWNDLYATGDGVIWHFDGQTWTQAYTLLTNFGGQEFPVSLTAIWGSGPGDVYAVGVGLFPREEIIVHYDGKEWSIVRRQASLALLQDIWGSGPNDIYVAAGDGGILHYNGSTWSQIAFGYFVSVWGADANHVYAVGEHPSTNTGAIFRYTGGAWQPVYTEDVAFNRVWGLGPDDIYALGFEKSFEVGAMAAVVVHYDGSEWSRQRAPFSNKLWDIAGTENMRIMVGRGYAMWGDGNAPPPVSVWVTPGPSPTVTPTPTLTPTPTPSPTPTSTPTHTPTPTPTPTTTPTPTPAMLKLYLPLLRK